jgi:hypothetical protein
VQPERFVADLRLALKAMLAGSRAELKRPIGVASAASPSGGEATELVEAVKSGEPVVNRLILPCLAIA